ncbi:MAG: hypothetical protein J7K81_01550 [Methanophagales archaeon]|nr:hypothetical protein [Methanophagales archaeon]
MKLINTIRERTRQHWGRDRVSPSIVLAGGTLLDPSVLTIGFARRFTTYKRADLIFFDLKRLKKLLNDRWCPIQLIFAGKAHPEDDAGKQILQKISIFLVKEGIDSISLNPDSVMKITLKVVEMGNRL